MFSILFAASCLAAETPEQMAIEGKWCHQRAKDALNDYDVFVNAYTTHGDFTRADVKLAKPAFDTLAALWEKAAVAWDKGEETDARQFRVDAEKGIDATVQWRNRLEARVRQAAVYPNEAYFLRVNGTTALAAKPAMAALIDAKRDAAEAWCNLAEAITPDADPTAVDELRESALVANDEAEIANMAYAIANARAQAVADPMVTSTELTKATAALQKIDEERIALKRDDLERTRRQRQLDRDRIRAEERVRKAYQAAQHDASETK